MALNIRKIDLNNLRAYNEVVGNKQALMANQEGSVMTLEELQDSIGQQMTDVLAYDRAFLLSKIENRDKIYSSVYNGFISGIDIDFRVVAFQLIQLSETINRVTDTLNVYHRNILRAVNDRISEVTNIGKMADAQHKFNSFVSDTFSEDTNAFQFSDAARISDMGGTYRIGTFGNVSYVQAEGDAYISIRVLNQNVTPLSENGSVLSSNIEDAYSSISFAESEVAFNGSIAGADFSYPGVVLAVIIRLPAKRLINSIAYSDFASSPPELLGIYLSTFETDVPESTDWELLENYHFDEMQRGRMEATFTKQSAQSVMLLFGQKNRRNTKQDINPDEIARLIQQVESKDTKEAVDVRKVFLEALLESGRQVTRKDQIVYDLPTSVSSAASEVRKYLDRLMQLLRPAASVAAVNGFLYDLGLHGLSIQYNEYRTFGIYESAVKEVAGNVLSAQLSKRDMTTESVFVKYYLVFETLKKRLLGIGEARTSDVFVVDDSAQLTYPLDFYGRNASNLTVKVNGTELIPTYFTCNFGDKNDKIIVSVTIDSTFIQYGNVVKISYDVSDLDTNYATYDPSFVDVRQELGFPNIKRNLPRDPIATNIAVIRNTASGDPFIPVALNSGIKLVRNLVSGEAKILHVLDRQVSTFARVSSEMYSPTIRALTQDSDQVSEFFNPEQNLQMPVFDLFHGIIDEQVESGSIVSESGIYTRFPYVPGSVVVLVNDDVAYADSYKENATELRLIRLRTRTVNFTDDIKVSYVPLDETVFAISGESNIASPNKMQTIGGTDPFNAITLESYPFVDYRIINDIGATGQWTNINNVYSLKRLVSLTYAPMTITVNGRPAKNITDYRENTTPKFDPYVDANRNYQYYVEGNKVFFNTSILDDITVSYYTLGSRVKLRAELFRNDLSDQGNSPELYDYGLMINAQ